MPSLTPAQLQAAARDFLGSAVGDSVTDKLVESKADRSSVCREAQNTLRSAVESADSAIVIGTAMNRILKVAEGKEVKGTWATAAQDSLRASVLFAGAGLDRALKRLAEDALPLLVGFDDEVNKKFQTFAERAITDSGSVDPKQLVTLLLGQGASPRDTLVQRWTYELGGASAQSAERVAEFAGALGITDKDIRKRMNSTPTKNSALEKAFSARNDIAHELDVTKPEATVRQRLERIRRQRSARDVRAHVIEMLDLTQQMINDVAVRLADNGHA